jgi:hypothetical protein
MRSQISCILYVVQANNRHLFRAHKFPTHGSDCCGIAASQAQGVRDTVRSIQPEESAEFGLQNIRYCPAAHKRECYGSRSVSCYEFAWNVDAAHG